MFFGVLRTPKNTKTRSFSPTAEQLLSINPKKLWLVAGPLTMPNNQPKQFWDQLCTKTILTIEGANADAA